MDEEGAPLSQGIWHTPLKRIAANILQVKSRSRWIWQLKSSDHHHCSFLEQWTARLPMPGIRSTFCEIYEYSSSNQYLCIYTCKGNTENYSYIFLQHISRMTQKLSKQTIEEIILIMPSSNFWDSEEIILPRWKFSLSQKLWRQTVGEIMLITLSSNSWVSEQNNLTLLEILIVYHHGRLGEGKF